MTHTTNNPKAIFIKAAVSGSLGLAAFYYVLLWAITGDPSHPISQFQLFQPWMSLLILGFGIQVGLFWLMRKGVRFNIQEKKDATVAAGTGAAVSGMAMVACCAHHVVELLPILGISAAAVFLAEYQQELLMVGVVANLAGIAMLSWMLVGKAKPQEIYNWIESTTRKRQA